MIFVASDKDGLELRCGPYEGLIFIGGELRQVRCTEDGSGVELTGPTVNGNHEFRPWHIEVQE
jgi:hypothetical protein